MWPNTGSTISHNCLAACGLHALGVQGHTLQSHICTSDNKETLSRDGPGKATTQHHGICDFACFCTPWHRNCPSMHTWRPDCPGSLAAPRPRQLSYAGHHLQSPLLRPWVVHQLAGRHARMVPHLAWQARGQAGVARLGRSGLGAHCLQGLQGGRSGLGGERPGLGGERPGGMGG